MKKSFNEKQEAEYQFMTRWCLTIVDFISDHHQLDPKFVELQKSAFSDETKDKYLEEIAPGLYLKGLRQAFRDTNEMAIGASSEILDKLNAVLRDQFGKDLKDDLRDNLSRIKTIVKRGKIISDEDMRLWKNG